MSADVFLDTNILVYAIAGNDTRTAQAAALLRQGGVISVQVLNEFANVARRKLRRSWPEIAEALASLRVLFPDPRPIGLATHDAAVGIAARNGFAFYDSLIVASALEAGCLTLLSEDLQDGQVIDGRLTIRNPFGGCSAP
jgi:predicted nucleic acid-binding protein